MSDHDPAPPSSSDSLNGHTDPVIQHAAYGLRVWAQLKRIEPHESAFHAVAEMKEEDLRAVVAHFLFQSQHEADV